MVIGSGEGGKYLAWHLAKAGQRTAVIERRWIGGSCQEGWNTLFGNVPSGTPAGCGPASASRHSATHA